MHSSAPAPARMRKLSIPLIHHQYITVILFPAKQRVKTPGQVLFFLAQVLCHDLAIARQPHLNH